MDCPSVLGRTLKGLTVLVQSPNGVNCFCLSVRLPFDSPAALSLFVSARICPHPPPNPLNLLLCSKKNHSLHITWPTLGSLIYWTRIWPPLGPNRRYCLSSLFWHVLCVRLTGCAAFFLSLSWAQETATAKEFMLKTFRLFGSSTHIIVLCTTFFAVL